MSVQVKTNEFGQQYIELPLTIKNVSGSSIVVEKIFVQNITPPRILPQYLNITIDELKSDYSDVNILHSTSYSVDHIPSILKNDNKNFKVLNSFSLDNNSQFEFTVVFDPNASRNNILEGGYSAKVHVITSNYDDFIINLNARCSDKEIVIFSGSEFNDIESIFNINRSRIVRLNSNRLQTNNN
jgi:hypothetical protein|tara:strand:+ start:5181 stop:5732 length:552 start_codon:yes stop_codon:yes gene_type:complete